MVFSPRCDVSNPGVRTTESRTVRTLHGFKTSLSASIGLGAFSSTATAEYNHEVETTVTEETEKTFSRTNKITFTAPAGKIYRVLQDVVKFDSPLPSDDCELRCKYTVEEEEKGMHRLISDVFRLLVFLVG